MFALFWPLHFFFSGTRVRTQKCFLTCPSSPPALHREPCGGALSQLGWSPRGSVASCPPGGTPRPLLARVDSFSRPPAFQHLPCGASGMLSYSGRPRPIPGVWAGGGAGREQLWSKLRSFSRSGPLSLLDTSGILGTETQHALQRLYLLTQEIGAWPC